MSDYVYILKICKRVWGAVLQDPRKAVVICEDEEKLRADSPTMSDYVCTLKSCKRVWGAALRDPRKADGSREDEEKKRADSLAMSDFVCMLKSCRSVWGAKTDGGFMGDKRVLGTTDRGKIGIGVRSRKKS
jgi:hypothetical protein